jgi:hypothetical protein
MTSPAPRAPSRDSSFSDDAVRQRRAVQRTRSAPVATAPDVSQGTPATSSPGSRNISAPAQSIGRSNYQPIILMEYVGCLLLTAATPIATKTKQDGLSPYAGADMVKLASITVLYFILAALSTGGRGPGRMAAWFGGLILIVDGMLEASNIAKVFGVFTGGLAKAAGAAPAASTSGPGLETPGLVQNVANAALGGVFSEGNSAPQQVAAQQGGGSIATPNF